MTLNNIVGGQKCQVQLFLFAVDLSSALTTENLQAVLGDPNLVRELQQHLPSGIGGNPPPPPSEQLRSTLASPQFQQVIRVTPFAASPLSCIQ
jgi:hypothetical protein